MEQRLKVTIAEVMPEKGAWLVKLGTMADRVHLLVEVNPQFGLHRLGNAIKGRSAQILRDESHWLKCGYGRSGPTRISSNQFGAASLSVMTPYVETQTDR